MPRPTATLLACALVVPAACAPVDEGSSTAPADEAAEAATPSSGPIARNARDVALVVDHNHVARVSFTDTTGARHQVLAWGAINAKTPDPAHPQAAFYRNNAGGYGSAWGAGYASRMKNICTRYTGPPLPLLVTACDAPDGSHWALQSWQRLLPDGGWPATTTQAAYELHLSHWDGALPTFNVAMDWTAGGHLPRLFGSLTYRGEGVYGFSSTSVGAPLDGYGRNVYVDVLNPPWGRGWYRFNSGLTHRPVPGARLDDGSPAMGGNACIGMYALYGRAQPAAGDAYRATVLGPGVMPILRWEGPAPGPYDAATESEMVALQRTFVPPSDDCYR
jgi:hypothetical protein